MGELLGQSPAEIGTPYVVAILVAAVVALWGIVVWLIKEKSKEDKDQRERLAATAKENYDRANAAVDDMNKFQREVLIGIVKSNQDTMHRVAANLAQNTRVTEQQIKSTDELKLEIHALRMEAKDRKKKDGDSGIHP